MTSPQFTLDCFRHLPPDGTLLKDILNWFLASYREVHNHYSAKNKYFRSSVEIGYCGEPQKEYLNSDKIRFSLYYSGSWTPESFEQVDVSIPTCIPLSNNDDFFTHIDRPSEINKLASQVKENHIFNKLLETSISGHTIQFGDFNG